MQARGSSFTENFSVAFLLLGFVMGLFPVAIGQIIGQTTEPAELAAPLTLTATSQDTMLALQELFDSLEGTY